MKVNSLALNTRHFTIEHLLDSPENRLLSAGFVASNNARGLEDYLKWQAENDEVRGFSRTYLLKDSDTGCLACYFSLRTGLVVVRGEGDAFDAIPAVELSNFAVNDTYRNAGAKIKKIGAHVFYHFIIPLVKNVSDLVGAQLLHIYALPEEKLMRHYQSLGFTRLPQDMESFVHSHVKPAYDKGCIFMYQEL